MLWRPHVSARSSFSKGGWLPQHPADGAENLDGVPISCPCAGECKQWRSPAPLVLGCSLSSQRAFMVSQPSLCGLSLCRSCSVDSQLSFRRNFFKYRCTFEVFLGGGELSAHLPPSWTCLPQKCFFHGSQRCWIFNQDFPYCTIYLPHFYDTVDFNEQCM